MKTVLQISVAVLMWLLVQAGWSDDDTNTQSVDMIAKATQVIEEIYKIPEQGIPPALLQRAEALVIVPGVFKMSFMVGGRFGQGILMIRDEHTRAWSNPVFVDLAGGSVGLQIGVEATDIILVFLNRAGLADLVNGEFTLGADASIAAGPVGRAAAAATDLEFRSEIVSYSRSRGLFAGISLDGSVLEIDEEANASFYESPGINTSAILSGEGPQAPENVAHLQRVINKPLDPIPHE